MSQILLNYCDMGGESPAPHAVTIAGVGSFDVCDVHQQELARLFVSKDTKSASFAVAEVKV